MLGLFRLILISITLKNLEKKTCFESVSNPSCIDLFLANQVFSFQNTINVAKGLSDFHKLVLTVLKTSFQRTNQRKLATGITKALIQVSFMNNITVT